METALRRMAAMVESFADAFVAWLGTDGARPQNWPVLTWVLIGAALLLLWWLARRRRPTPLDVRPPQLLVTNGEVVPHGSPEPTPRGRRRPVEPSSLAVTGSLVMTVSNLSRYPVQLLEVALRENRRGAPDVADVNAIVPAMGSVSVEAVVPLSLRGDGWLDVYSYATVPRTKTHRHRVELVWEPWAARFKVAPLDQAVTPTRRLAGDEPNARFLDAVVAPAPASTRASAVRAAPADAVVEDAPARHAATPRAVEVPASGAPAATDRRPPASRPSTPRSVEPVAAPPPSPPARQPSRPVSSHAVDTPPPAERTAPPRPSAARSVETPVPAERAVPRPSAPQSVETPASSARTPEASPAPAEGRSSRSGQPRPVPSAPPAAPRGPAARTGDGRPSAAEARGARPGDGRSREGRPADARPAAKRPSDVRGADVYLRDARLPEARAARPRPAPPATTPRAATATPPSAGAEPTGGRAPEHDAQRPPRAAPTAAPRAAPRAAATPDRRPNAEPGPPPPVAGRSSAAAAERDRAPTPAPAAEDDGTVQGVDGLPWRTDPGVAPTPRVPDVEPDARPAAFERWDRTDWSNTGGFARGEVAGVGRAGRPRGGPQRDPETSAVASGSVGRPGRRAPAADEPALGGRAGHDVASRPAFEPDPVFEPGLLLGDDDDAGAPDASPRSSSVVTPVVPRVPDASSSKTAPPARGRRKLEFPDEF